MKLKISFLCLLFIPVIFTPFSVHAQSSNPQQTLTQYISDLQKNPNDNALREKIIRHVQGMRPAPAIPLEVERFEGRAEFAIKNAKTEADFLDAAKEYEKVLLIAPWVPAYYFNQGIAFEKAGKLKEAKQSFEFYLLAAPDAQDARDVRKRIAGLEYGAEKAAKDKELAAKKAVEEKRAQQEAAEANKAKEQEEFLRKINGARYIYLEDGKVGAILNVIGDTITWVVESDRRPGSWEPNGFTFKIDGRTLRDFLFGRPDPWQDGVITEDGRTITITQRATNGTIVFVFKRER